MGVKKGFLRSLLTRDFLYSIVTSLTDAPLAQLDRALDYEQFGALSYLPVFPAFSIG
jgi:hypothetical protein